MAESLARPPFFSVPSWAVMSDKVAWLSEARHFYKAKLLELEHQFESKVAELNEKYLAVIQQIRESQAVGIGTQWRKPGRLRVVNTLVITGDSRPLAPCRVLLFR